MKLIFSAETVVGDDPPWKIRVDEPVDKGLERLENILTKRELDGGFEVSNLKNVQFLVVVFNPAESRRSPGLPQLLQGIVC